ncbi:hypothetical protein [Microcoleus phage My-WqHQDG]|nr:hypothetical protein [Microcoleus phage My-WqHQDG]
MNTTETTDLLDLGLDNTEADANADVQTVSAIPDSALNEAEENLTAHVKLNTNENYAVVDLYPEVQLPQVMLSAIACDESLQEIQQQIDYLEAELQASRNALNNQIMTLQNKAKAELVATQVAADESLVTNALGNPEMMRVLASVLRIMQQHGKAGFLMEALDTIEHGNPQSAMTRLATTIAPQYETPMYEPSIMPNTPPEMHSEPVVEPIQTTAAPTARKRAKWVPG